MDFCKESCNDHLRQAAIISVLQRLPEELQLNLCLYSFPLPQE